MLNGGLEDAKRASSSTTLGRSWIAATSLRIRRWIKDRQTPFADLVYRTLIGLRRLEMPVIRSVQLPLYYACIGVASLLSAVARVLWWTPLFKARLTGSARGLYLYGGGLPLIAGPLSMQVGRGCRISTQTTFVGRSAGDAVPELIIGNNVYIGWQTTIAVGRRVVFGDNVLVAGRALLAGYPGHPLDATARAAGLPDTPDQIGDIVLEDDVWLATGVTVCADVRIGRGTVVAAGSVVTRDLPAYVLAGGVPAKVIRTLRPTMQEHTA